jgi:Arc/MetJ-type ribon-helix-helix transcriptional regulator
MNLLKAQMEAAVVAQIAESLREEGEDAIAFAIREGTTFEEAIESIVTALSENELLLAGIESRVREMRERHDRFESRSEKLREALRDLLCRANMRKLVLPECTLSLSAKPQSVVIADESALPEQFIRIKKEPDKAAIKEALKRGEQITGAALSNGGETLTIRRK